MSDQKIYQKLCAYVSRKEHPVPLMILYPPPSQNTNIYPVIHFIGAKQMRKYEESNQFAALDFHPIKIATYTFSRHVYKINKQNTKTQLTQWIYKTIKDPDLLKFTAFNNAPLSKIMADATRSTLQLVQAKRGDDCKYFIVSMKDKTNDNRKKKEIHKTDKIDVVSLISRRHFESLTIKNILNVHNWCMHLAEDVLAMKNKKCANISNTAPGYYYSVRRKSMRKHRIAVTDFQLTPHSHPISYTHNSDQYIAGVDYDDNAKPIKHIQTFLKKSFKKSLPNNQNGTVPIWNAEPKKYLPITESVNLNVLPHELVCQIFDEHKKWVASGKGSHHFTPEKGFNGKWHRCKSMVYREYLWETDAWKNKIQLFEDAGHKWKYAGKRLAEGLRYIDESCPVYLNGVITYLKLSNLIPCNLRYDQIGINWYRANAFISNQSLTTSSLGPHAEAFKFKTLHQLNIGMPTMLAFDGRRGVSCNAALALPSSSFVKYDMSSYWMGAELINGKDKGGKHAVNSRDMSMSGEQWRITFLFRECQDKANNDCMKHFKECNNNDARCYCLNPRLKRK